MFLWLPTRLAGVLLKTVNLSALFFIGFVFPFRRMHERLLLFLQFHLCPAFGGTGFVFLIKQSGFLGRPPLFVQVGDLNFPGILIFGDGNDIAYFDIFARFTTLAVNVDFAAINSIGRQTAGFEKPRGPKPFIDANFGYFSQAADRSPTRT